MQNTTVCQFSTQISNRSVSFDPSFACVNARGQPFTLNSCFLLFLLLHICVYKEEREKGRETLFSIMIFYTRYTNKQSLVLLVQSPTDKEK